MGKKWDSTGKIMNSKLRKTDIKKRNESTSEIFAFSQHRDLSKL